jgi:hypothetical protein
VGLGLFVGLQVPHQALERPLVGVVVLPITEVRDEVLANFPRRTFTCVSLSLKTTLVRVIEKKYRPSSKSASLTLPLTGGG